MLTADTHPSKRFSEHVGRLLPARRREQLIKRGPLSNSRGFWLTYLPSWRHVVSRTMPLAPTMYGSRRDQIGWSLKMADDVRRCRADGVPLHPDATASVLLGSAALRPKRGLGNRGWRSHSRDTNGAARAARGRSFWASGVCP
jgi:hypothetical protein